MHEVGNMYFVIKVLDLFQSSFPQVSAIKPSSTSLHIIHLTLIPKSIQKLTLYTQKSVQQLTLFWLKFCTVLTQTQGPLKTYK